MSKYLEYKKGKEIEWLELNILRTGETMSKALISELAGDVDEDEISGWLIELKNRTSMYVNPYYEINKNRLVPLLSWEDIPEYFLCVYYSYYGADDNSGGTKLFEKISAQSLKNFINGEVYTIGFPEGRGLNAYLDEFINLCFETRGVKADGTYKDDGVDVIGFKLFEDMRSANLYILLQCAAGIHWKAKKKIELNRWTKYIYWYPECIVSSISTVDFVSQKQWEKQSSSFGMLIDRVRIYNTLYKYEVNEELRIETTNWVNIIAT